VEGREWNIGVGRKEAMKGRKERKGSLRIGR